MPLVQHVELSQGEGLVALLDGEEIRFTEYKVKQESPFCEVSSAGTLIVTNQRVIWVNPESSGNGSSYHFRDISMHSIQSETDSSPPCIYCHLDTETVTEIKFIPENRLTLKMIYDAFCKGAAENPDFDEEEPTDAWISSAMEDDDNEGFEEGQFDDTMEENEGMDES